MKLSLFLCSVAACALAACSSSDADPESPADGPYGDFVRVDVSGRGVVSSNPGGIYCGNDGDQRRCDGEFLFQQDETRTHITLAAKEVQDWSFKEWLITTEGQIAYESPDPELDRTKATLELTPGTVTEPSGKTRARRYRVTAVFIPISATTANAAKP